jgi:hypothetical protein
MSTLAELAEEVSRIRQNVEFKIGGDDFQALEKVEAYLIALAQPEPEAPQPAAPAPVPFIPGDHRLNVLAVIEAYCDALNDEDQEGGPISPNGDDFNDVLSAIETVLAGRPVTIRLTHDGR